MVSIGVLPRLALALGVTLASPAAPSARAADTILIGSVDATSANLWPLYVGAKQGLFRRRRPQARRGVLAVERVGDPAARRRLLQHRAQRRHRRSDPRYREGRAGLDHPHPDPVAALCALGQARDQEPQGPQGQDHHDRRRQGRHPHLHRAHAGAERAEERRLRLHLRRRHQRALFGAAIGRRRCGDPHRAVQLLCGVGGLHQSRLHLRLHSRHAVRRAWR